MGYTTVRGGEDAIRAAEALERTAGGDASGISVGVVLEGMRYAVDAVMGEAGLYAPELAALAVVEAQGDLAEAAFLLRAYRSTLPRVGYTTVSDTGRMRLIRRVSSAFKDVPGGQILGPTRDYSQRLLGSAHEREPLEPMVVNGQEKPDGKGELPKITDLLRGSGISRRSRPEHSGEPFDLTRTALKVPAPRSGRLQALARGETGTMTALAYSALRGFGISHPTLAEFRVGYLPLKIEHPHLGAEVEIGEISCTEVEAVGRETGYGGGGREEANGEANNGEANRGDENTMSLGYGLVFGRNERKAIAMANLDAAIRAGSKREQGPAAPAEDEEFVLYHTDGIEAAGFVEHLKLPHYVTFQSSLDRLREVQRRATENGGENCADQ